MERIAALLTDGVDRAVSPNLSEGLEAVSAGGLGAVGRSMSGSRLEARSILRAGGAETSVVETFEARIATGALYTSRGPTYESEGVQYKPFNEDGAVLGAVVSPAEELVYAGVFDQAGGEGHLAGETGAASKAAALAFERAACAIAAGDEPETALARAVEEAQGEVASLAKRSSTRKLATTAAAFIIRQRAAHVLNIGDSAVLHFSAAGVLQNQTLSHNMYDELARETGDPNRGLWLATKLTRAINGNVALGPDQERWPLAPRDLVCAFSDGVLDANLIAQEEALRRGRPWSESSGAVTLREISQKIAARPGASPAELAAELRDYALARMRDRRGKPDNISIVVVQIREGEP